MPKTERLSPGAYEKLRVDQNLPKVKMMHYIGSSDSVQVRILYSNEIKTAADSFQPTGAYIFRPETDAPILDMTVMSVDKVETPLFTEYRHSLDYHWGSYIIREYNAPINEVEVEWLVGPIPSKYFT